MKVVFRVDASLEIGAGHVMRCITLAASLTHKSCDVTFICCDHKGNLINLIKERGFSVYVIHQKEKFTGPYQIPHESWLWNCWEEDLIQTFSILQDLNPDYVIVDHYSIDYRWETAVKEKVINLLVIDDLQDRKHACHLLLDQNYIHDSEKSNSRYDGLVSSSCIKLLGPKYSLIRDEFIAAKKQLELNPRASPILEGCRVLVCFGGVDFTNLTGRVIETLFALHRLKDVSLTVYVVIGSQNPNREKLEALINKLENSKFQLHLYVQINFMAKLMLESDICVGAGGITNWERILLQLPSYIITIADNQVPGTIELHKAGALVHIAHFDNWSASNLIEEIITICTDQDKFKSLMMKCASLVDGDGAERVAAILFSLSTNARTSQRE